MNGNDDFSSMSEFWWHVLERIGYLSIGLAAALVVLGILAYEPVRKKIFPGFSTAMGIVQGESVSEADARMASAIFISIAIRIAAVIFMVTMFTLYM